MGNEDNAHHEAAGDTTDALAKLASKGPLWIRAMALLVAVLTAGAPYWKTISEYMDNRNISHILSSTYSLSGTAQQPQYQGGTPVDPQTLTGSTTATSSTSSSAPSSSTSDAVAPGNLAVVTMSSADSAHLALHAQRMETPSFKRLPVGSSSTIVAYAAYPSDGCILIDRLDGKTHQITSNLARAATTAADATPADTKALELPPEVEQFQRALRVDAAWELPTRRAESPEEATAVSNTNTSADADPTGCVNPHPGQFQYWSKSVNDCSEQVFRRFKDGCTHYQFHDKCRNTWDPAVHWTVCISGNHF